MTDKDPKKPGELFSFVSKRGTTDDDASDPAKTGAKRSRSARVSWTRDDAPPPVDRICEAALALFVEKGYRSTTLDAIARRGGLTKGAIYYYFDSKVELLAEILDRVEASYPRGKPDSGDPCEKLVNFLHTQAKWAIQRPNDLFLLMLLSIEFKDNRSRMGRKVRKIYDEMSGAMSEILAEGQASGAFRSSLSPRQLGAFYVAAHDGLMLEWYRGGRTLKKGEELVQALRHVMLSTLKPGRQAA